MLTTIKTDNHLRWSRSSAKECQNLAARGISLSLKSNVQLWIIGESSPTAVDKKKNAHGRCCVKNAKSSLALKGSLPWLALPSPKTYLPTLRTCSASSLVLALMGVFVTWLNSYWKPSDFSYSRNSVSLAIITRFRPYSKERIDPLMNAFSEITLKR